MTQPFVSSWHDPSDMQRSETNESPNNEYGKDEKIIDGGQQGLTLTETTSNVNGSQST